MNNDLAVKFQEYLNEIEGFGLRSERLYDDFSKSSFRWTDTERMELITKWMEAAHQQGARDMAQLTLETLTNMSMELSELSVEYENRDEVQYYTREQAFHMASNALMVYYVKMLDGDQK